MSRPRTVVVTPAVLRDWELPLPTSGKESRGHLLVATATASTPGAVLLSAEGALRAGAGKLTVVTCQETAAPLAVALPEAMVVPVACDGGGNMAESAAETILGLADRADTLVTGPGFTDPEAAVRLLELVIPELDVSLVLDALGSAFLGVRPEGLRHLAGRAVLTVNSKELAKTAHCSQSRVESDPATIAAEVAERSEVVVVCGGTDKHVAAPDGRSWLLEGGGPGLGISGSGDVQAGIVAGLLARGAEPAQAAVWAAYVHGRAGERLATEFGPLGGLAREQLEQIPLVLAEIG
jgi:ADP-dependent NAD(P)H-hydrate dehydratase